jgi:phasin family protein
MFSSITELSAVTKSQLETQLNLLNTFATTAFAGAQKVIALNLSTTKASVEKSSATALQLLEAKDPQAFFNAAKAPTFDNVLAYGRELFSIASKTQAELLLVTKEQFKEAGVQVPTLQLVASAAAPLAPAVAAVVVKPANVVEAVAADVTEDVIEVAAAAPKVAAKAEAKAKPATPVKAVAEAVGVNEPKPAAASFPDPKTSVAVKAEAAPAKPKKQ